MRSAPGGAEDHRVVGVVGPRSARPSRRVRVAGRRRDAPRCQSCPDTSLVEIPSHLGNSPEVNHRTDLLLGDRAAELVATSAQRYTRPGKPVCSLLPASACGLDEAATAPSRIGHRASAAKSAGGGGSRGCRGGAVRVRHASEKMPDLCWWGKVNARIAKSKSGSFIGESRQSPGCSSPGD